MLAGALTASDDFTVEVLAVIPSEIDAVSE